MRENCSVRCELEGSSRQGESEQKMIGDQSPKASILHKKEFFSAELERRVQEGVYTKRHSDRYDQRN